MKPFLIALLLSPLAAPASATPACPSDIVFSPFLSTHGTLVDKAQAIVNQIKAQNCSFAPVACSYAFDASFCHTPRQSNGPGSVGVNAESLTESIVYLKVGAENLLVKKDLLARKKYYDDFDRCSVEPYAAPAGSLVNLYSFEEDVYYVRFISRYLDRNLDQLRIALGNAKAAMRVLVNAGVCLPPPAPATCGVRPVRTLGNTAPPPEEPVTVTFLNYSAPGVLSGTLSTHDGPQAMSVLRESGICK